MHDASSILFIIAAAFFGWNIASSQGRDKTSWGLLFLTAALFMLGRGPYLFR